jgi:hypothetical protein
MPTLDYDRSASMLVQVRRELVAQVAENGKLKAKILELKDEKGNMARRMVEMAGRMAKLEGIVTACENVLRKLFQEHYFMAAVAPEAKRALEMVEELLFEDAHKDEG